MRFARKLESNNIQNTRKLRKKEKKLERNYLCNRWGGEKTSPPTLCLSEN